MATTSVTGLVSGIDSQSVIDALVKADQASTHTLTDSKTKLQAESDAIRTFNTKALSAQLDLSDLKRASTYTARTATTSDSTALTATAANSSAIGSYRLDVVHVAKNHELITTAQASATDNLGAGSFSVRVGSGAVTTINFAASASSLNDVAQALNQAKIGVTASVINDGSGTPYRLILHSNQTGVANALAVSGTGGLTGLASGVSELTAAADAQVRLGSGPSAITVTSSTNTVTSIIPGVTLNLQKEATGLTVNVGSDHTAASSAMKSFVSSYNAFLDYKTQNASFDTGTKQGGILLSQSDLVEEVSATTRALTGSVAGLPASLSTLSSLGVTLDSTGTKLAFDQGTFEAAYDNDPDGVMRVLGNSGSSSLSGVSFAAMSNKTSTAAPFAVDITSAASQATLSGTPVAASTVIDGSNDNLAITINGTAYSVTLAHATYTASGLAQQVQSAINAQASGGGQVTVGLDGSGALAIKTKFYGSGQTLSTFGNTALGLTAIATAGTDVVGTINGSAPITGNGQVLSGLAGTGSEGLILTVTATGPLSGAQITVRKGLAVQADTALAKITDVSAGTAAIRENGLISQITGIDDKITKRDAILAQNKARYTKEFTTMESLIARFKSQGDTITSLIGAWTNSTK